MVKPMSVCKSCGGSGHVMKSGCKKAMDPNASDDEEVEDGPMMNHSNQVCPMCGGTGVTGGAQ